VWSELSISGFWWVWDDTKLNFHLISKAMTLKGSSGKRIWELSSSILKIYEASAVFWQDWTLHSYKADQIKAEVTHTHLLLFLKKKTYKKNIISFTLVQRTISCWQPVQRGHKEWVVVCVWRREKNLHKLLNVDFPRAGKTTFTLELKLFF